MVLVIFAGTFLTNYAKFFEIDNASKGADAIICLSWKQTRIPKTVQLWNLGYSEKVFLTDEKKKFRIQILGNKQFTVSQKKRFLRIKNFDIPWEVIPNRDGGATSTFDEAVDVLSFAKLRNWKRIIIVTDFFHTDEHYMHSERFLKKAGLACRWQESEMIFLMPTIGGSQTVVFWLISRRR